jgi:hypothetical protein
MTTKKEAIITPASVIAVEAEAEAEAEAAVAAHFRSTTFQTH